MSILIGDIGREMNVRGSKPGPISIFGVGKALVEFAYIVSVTAGQATTPKFTFTGASPAAAVDWGDGTAQSPVTSGVELSHTYAADGTYRVKLAMGGQYARITQIDISADYVTGILWSSLMLNYLALTRVIDLWAVGFGEVGIMRIAR